MAAGGEHPDLQVWRQRVQAWYPAYLQRPYFQPAVFFNRTQHHMVQFGGQNILVTQPPVSTLPPQPPGAARPAVPVLLDSDARDDSTHVRVLRCLQDLPGFETEVMFIISQMDFGQYLNQPTFAAAAATLPTPIQLSRHLHRGDFDLLLLHHVYGIIVSEIKAIGDQPSHLTQQSLLDRVRKAVRQLKKDVTVLNHVTSDMPTPPRVLATLMLPNISTAQLQSALATDPQLSQVRD
jgi:hypothetical protein